MIKQTCPFGSKANDKKDLGGKPQSLSLDSQATAIRDQKVAEIYSLSQAVITEFWKKYAAFIDHTPPGLLREDGSIITAERFESHIGSYKSREQYSRLLSKQCSLSLRQVMTQTCQEQLEISDSPLRRLAVIYKLAPNYRTGLTVEEYLQAGLVNAVGTIIPAFQTTANLLDKHPDKYAHLDFETIAKKSKPFILGLASSHLAVFASIVRTLQVDETKGFLPSDFLFINDNQQLALTSDFTKGLKDRADRIIAADPALSHTKIGCPAMKADGNVVTKMYDWMLSLTLKRADLFAPQKLVD